MPKRTVHLCLSVRGALLDWPVVADNSWFCHNDGRPMAPSEAKAALLDELSKGHEFIPCGPPCAGFDPKLGCPGHDEPDEAVAEPALSEAERLAAEVDRLATLNQALTDDLAAANALARDHFAAASTLAVEAGRLKADLDAVIRLHVERSAVANAELWDVLLPDPMSPLGLSWHQDIATRDEAVGLLLKAAGRGPDMGETREAAGLDRDRSLVGCSRCARGFPACDPSDGLCLACVAAERDHFHRLSAEHRARADKLGSALEGAAALDRVKAERDAILRWSIRHAGYIGTRDGSDGLGPWWARGDSGWVLGRTAEEVVRKAAGLNGAPS